MFLHWKGLPQIRFRSSERLRRFKQQILVRSSKGKVTKNSIKRHWRFLTRWKTQSIIYRSENLEASKTAEDQSITLVKERQKLILLADKSQRRWKTVQEYVQHELAEKKIYPAEARASTRTRRDLPSIEIPLQRGWSRGSTFGQVARLFGSQRSPPGAYLASGHMGKSTTEWFNRLLWLPANQSID